MASKNALPAKVLSEIERVSTAVSARHAVPVEQVREKLLAMTQQDLEQVQHIERLPSMRLQYLLAGINEIHAMALLGLGDNEKDGKPAPKKKKAK